MAESVDKELWAAHPTELRGLRRLQLLNALEAKTRALFKRDPAFEGERAALGAAPEQRARLLAAALDQQWTGIPEYTEEFYRAYAACARRQRLQRAFVRAALADGESGFDPLERCLLHHASLVGDAYDQWYPAWARAVQALPPPPPLPPLPGSQCADSPLTAMDFLRALSPALNGAPPLARLARGNEVATRLAADAEAGAVPPELFNHYTIIAVGEGPRGYRQSAYAAAFPHEVGVVTAALDAWVADLRALEGPGVDAGVRDQHTDYLAHYRACLAETDVDRLEGLWAELDRKWMRITYWIQIVHDIEYGYGDPLRVKVSPEFSCRLQDEEFAADNKTIEQIQGVMVEYFQARTGRFAREGLSALRQSLAAIYYLPFQSAANLFFRFSGQSIPNRSDIRTACGVKIYFDPVSTAAREGFARDLARRVLADPAAADCIETVATIVYHVGAHEIGHAIYGLDCVKDRIRVSTKTLLEEPRAELTALHTLRLLLRGGTGLVDEAAVRQYVASFMLQDLRRFAMWSSQATRPYAVSAAACWARAEALGYVGLNAARKVVFDDSKCDAFLAESSALFERILDAEDAEDGPAIEQVLSDMEAASTAPIVKHLLGELFTPAE